MSSIKKNFQYGRHTVSMETGEIANQATGAVLVNMEGTTVLVTVVAAKEASPEIDFLPLTVHYEERAYAAGKVPGGFLRREGRSSERETLIARLIDRPIRPLFPNGFTHEVQIVAMVVSVNPDISPDIPALIGASAALAISGIPFNGPLGAARVGYVNEQFVLNPTQTELNESQLDLVVAGTEQAIYMVESEAQVLPEPIMLEAVWYGHEQMQTAITAIAEFAATAGKTKWEWQPPVANEALNKEIAEFLGQDLAKAYQIKDKLERDQELNRLRKLTVEKFSHTEEYRSAEQILIRGIIEKTEKRVICNNLLAGAPRMDGRDTRTVRPLDIKVGVLSRTHGSALFTRGETQALVVTTLGTERDAQMIESILGNSKDQFLLHYNFPPYCTGEIGMIGSPRRRSIGHGRLAKRGVLAVLPSQEEFPYMIRVVSEITSSNGSSSMASVCGASLSMMDAGVPLKAPVSGVAMGLIKEGNKFVILTDILGSEDHFGDMDFKVVGTAEGITALQMDIKTDGINKLIMEAALKQAKEGRLHILKAMNDVIAQSRETISDYAPTIKTMKIDPAKIKDVIGKGGVTIRAITEETGATIDVKDDGTLSIAAVDNVAGKKAWDIIQQIIGDLELNKIYTGTVAKILDFGAIVTIVPGKDGLLHISQIADTRINKVSDVLKEGQTVQVKVIEIDRTGRVRLSSKPSELEVAPESSD